MYGFLVKAAKKAEMMGRVVSPHTNVGEHLLSRAHIISMDTLKLVPYSTCSRDIIHWLPCNSPFAL